MGYLFYGCLAMRSHRSPNITGYFHCSQLPSRIGWLDLITEDLTYLNVTQSIYLSESEFPLSE